MPSEHPLEILIRQLDTRSVEEERGQNSRLRHYPDFTMPEPWVRVSASGVKRREKNKFKDILTSTFHAWLLSDDIPSPLLCLFHVWIPHRNHLHLEVTTPELAHWGLRWDCQPTSNCTRLKQDPPSEWLTKPVASLARWACWFPSPPGTRGNEDSEWN